MKGSGGVTVAGRSASSGAGEALNASFFFSSFT